MSLLLVVLAILRCLSCVHHIPCVVGHVTISKCVPSHLLVIFTYDLIPVLKEYFICIRQNIVIADHFLVL